MTRLGAVIAQAIVAHYGRDEVLCRLANPSWFQAFGAVMGMDWHSSGITTSVVGTLKRRESADSPHAGWPRWIRNGQLFPGASANAHDPGLLERGGA